TMNEVKPTVEIRGFRPGDGPTVEALFTRMYAHMMQHGLRLPLAPNGAQLWVDSAVRGHGRSGHLVVCVVDGNVAGFAHGAIKLAPGYLGGQKLGVVTHVFVEDQVRSMGLGRQMVEALEAWLTAHGSLSIELQVLGLNAGAVSFWHTLGYQEELLQL